MRTLIHIVVGAAAGLALGILIPIATYFIFELLDPKANQGAGTVFAILIILTAPLGAIAGAIWGFRRLHQPPRITNVGPEGSLAEFEDMFGTYSQEEQCIALGRVLPRWIDQFNKETRIRLTIAGLILLLLGVWRMKPIVLLLMVPYVLNTAWMVYRMRSLLEKIRQRWGPEVVDQQGELPLLLRPFPARH